MSRPRIAVSGVVRSWDNQPRSGVNSSYVRAVLAAGGLPMIVSPDFSREDAVELFTDCDGLLLTGGEDVDPARYGAPAHAELGAVDARRDENELALIIEARARDLPILGICRGIQVCNVAFGGTLLQDLPSERPGAIDHDPPRDRQQRTHPVRITPETRLAGLLETVDLSVNSFHHQAVDRVGEGLVISAVAPDGVVEGIESADAHDWIVAVQWHPEELVHEPNAADLKLFAGFVTAARRS